MPVAPGVNVAVVEEPALGPGAPTDTSTTFLLTADPAGPQAAAKIASPDDARTVYPTATTLHAEVDAIQREGRSETGVPLVQAIRIMTTAPAAPTAPTATPSTTGGTLAAGAYYYKVSALNAGGESAASTEVSAVTTGATGSVALAWTASAGATGYLIYRGTAAGAETVLYAPAGIAVAFTDTGAASTPGVPRTVASGGLQGTLDALAATLGPGQVVAPSIVASADIATIGAWCWTSNRVLIANGPVGATDAQLSTLAAAVIASGNGRNVALFADTAIIPGIGAATRQVPWSLVEAGIIARNDLRTGNPALAAAGDQGIAVYALGLLAERADVAMTTLNTARVNVARAPFGGAPRGYGYRTLADLAILPQWWDLGGSRVVMDVRSNSASSSDRILFAPFDVGGKVLAKWNGLLSDRCLELLRVGALFGSPVDAFTVDTGPALNPTASLAAGRGRATIRLKTAPFAESLDVSIVRQPIA